MANPTQTSAPIADAGSMQEGGTYGTGAFKRTVPVHYGWKDGELYNENKNVLSFFEAKNYGAPYFWASIVSLIKAITVETYAELLTTLGEIRPGFATNKTPKELVESAEPEHLELLWDVIFKLSDIVNESNGSPLKPRVDADGCISFRARHESHQEGSTLNNFGTPPTPVALMENYINFISLIGATRKITISDLHTPRETSLEEWLPIEGLAIPSNQNLSLIHI